MATKKEITKLLKELNLTKEDMQKFYDDLEEVNPLVKQLKKSGVNWDGLNIQVLRELPTQKERDLERIKKEEQERIRKEAAKKKEEEEMEFYEMHWEECIVKKIDSGELLTIDELIRLRDYEEDREYGDNRRWSRSVTSICELCGRYYQLNWEEGLTEYQDNEFPCQPFEVEKHTYEKTITVIEWQPKK